MFRRWASRKDREFLDDVEAEVAYRRLVHGERAHASILEELESGVGNMRRLMLEETVRRLRASPPQRG